MKKTLILTCVAAVVLISSALAQTYPNDPAFILNWQWGLYNAAYPGRDINATVKPPTTSPKVPARQLVYTAMS